PAVADGPRIWLLGGLVGHHPGPATADVWVYDTEADAWTAGPPLLAARGAGAAALLGRTIHFFGGAERASDGTNLVDRADHWSLDLDAVGAGWQPRAPLPDPRNHLGGAALDGRVYAVGGQHGGNDTTGNSATVSVYDPGAADRTWLRLPALPAPRKGPVVGVVDGELLAATGNGGGAVPTTTTWSLRRAGRWEQLPAMPVAMGDVAAGVVGSRVLVVGAGTAATYEGDLATGTWRTRATRPHTGSGSAAEVLGGKLHVVGGTGPSAGRLQVFDPAANRWTLGPAPPFAASGSSSAVVDGKLYVAGGVTAGATTAAVARFDPGTGRWEALAPLPLPRNRAAAGSDGRRLLVFGGTGPGSGDAGGVADGFATVQAFDPATGTWATSDDGGSGLAPLPQARGGTGRAVEVGATSAAVEAYNP
ncbi:MAG: Kelch repeat-containing protein, partial [Acidimicrobiales bacterium]|nr:Kelch repeat-containing protein [Acidimicrobiales bacterium]